MVPFSVKCDYAKGICVITGGTIKCKMPSDTISLVTTGLGVSVLAGIISGVCYVLVHGIGTRKRFPQDPVRRNLWFSLVGIVEGQPLPKNPQLCSDHFFPNDLMRRSNGTRYVKKGANPRRCEGLIFLDDSSDSSDSSVFGTPPLPRKPLSMCKLCLDKDVNVELSDEATNMSPSIQRPENDTPTELICVSGPSGIGIKYIEKTTVTQKQDVDSITNTGGLSSPTETGSAVNESLSSTTETASETEELPVTSFKSPGISKERNRKKKLEWYCDICGAYLHSTINILNDDLVTCSKCGAKACASKCSRLVQHTIWVCNNCLKPPESWFKGILRSIQPKNTGSEQFNTTMNPELQSNPELDSLRKLEKEQVRDFIEKLVNVMLGENVDNASVSMLYNDNHYKLLFDRYHQDLSNTLADLGSVLHISMSNLPVTGQSPSSALAALKQLIDKLLTAAVNLPLLERAHADQTTPPEDTANRTYEDLLATAIINKVTTSYQNNLPSSSTNSVSSRVSSTSRHKDDKEYFFGKETLDTKWKTTDLDTTSVSSLEEWLQSESSFGSKKYVDKVALMIKQDIEEVENVDSANEEDDAEYFRSSSSLLNDSDSNWFLQKRQFQGTHSPVPVPMLVPNPATDAKVLIGDKPLDDTSDLSDVGSDYEESIQPHTTHSLLVQSKGIIGGGKPNFEIVQNGDERSESSTDSGIKEFTEKEPKSFDLPESSKTDISLDDDNVEDSSFISAYSNTEKEAEYTEQYASLPRQILKTSTPKQSSNTEPRADSPNSKRKENGLAYEDASDIEFLGGNYSKKEKEKWKHAVEMKNNPYSKESIERRIKRSNSAAGSLFGPDYYARLAGKPSGGEKLLSSEINNVSWPPPETRSSRSPSPPPELPKVGPPPIGHTQTNSFLPLEQIKISPPPRSFTQTLSDSPPEPPKTQPPSREFIETNGIHKALKAVITPVEENMPNNTFETHMEVVAQETKSEVHRAESYSVQTNTCDVTSDSDMSFINFYDVEHAQVVRKSKNEDIHIPIKHTPFGVSYKSLPSETETNNNIVNNSFDNSHFDTRNENNIAVKGAPVAKPRVLATQSKKENGLYIKSSSATKHRNSTSLDNPMLRRHLSESSLIEDSFDAPPKILHQKRDNTLISKIYKDPKVRLFALHSREEIPGTEGEYIKPAFHTQRSFDAKVTHSENSSLYLSKGRSYNSSDDGINSEYESGKTGKMSFFSSEEDLLSLNSEISFRPSDVVATKNEDVKFNESLNIIAHPPRDRTPSRERTPSPNAILTPRTPSTRKFIYGSHEDLLSIDEVGSIPRRKDNTLISKIYKDPNVRNFALKTHKVPDYEPAPITPKHREVFSSDDEHYHSDGKRVIHKQTFTKRQLYSSYDDLPSAEISIETHQNHHNNHDASVAPTFYSDEPDGVEDDIVDVEKRHVVQHVLGKFSKSEVNLKSEFYRSSSLEQDDGIRVSVRDLRKKFENNDTSNKPVISSLTARSLSKQVKESLRQ